MAYMKRTIVLRDENGVPLYMQIEKYFSLRLGGKKTRIPNWNPSTEKQAYYNYRQRLEKFFWLILCNFVRDDIYLTLTYAQEPTDEEAKEHIRKFMRGLRRLYRKRGMELKYITVTECHGVRIHHHLIIGDPSHGKGAITRKDIRDLWPWGMINHYAFQRYDGSPEDAKQLAAYLLKESKKNIREGTFRKSWSASRNLKRPETHRNTIRSRAWREKPVPPKGMELVSVENTYTNWGYPKQVSVFRKRGRMND